MSKLVEVSAPDFTGVTVHDGRELRTALVGTADYAAIDALNELLDKTHAEAIRLEASAVAIDVQALEFMNSSCFKSLLQWIGNIQALAPERQYQVRFVMNPELHWQKRSLQSLRCFAIDLITVTTK